MGDEHAKGLADELRLLRQRAYGPEADIGSDPQAVARLETLEQQVGPADLIPEVARFEPPAAMAEAPGAGDRTEGPSISDASDASVTGGGESAPDGPPRVAMWWRRHGWAAPVAAAAVTAVASVAVTIAILSVQRTPALILEQDESAAWPADDFGRRPDGALLFDDALGLRVITQPQGWGAGDETQVCLLISYGGLFTGGCAAEPYLPTASLALTEELPDELLARFPDAAALQFVLDDGRVLIYETRR